MRRKLEQKLLYWKDRDNRHPLILRGARQVGKTYIVRQFARTAFSHFLELNFEADPSLSSLFKSKDPSDICELLFSKFNIPLEDGKTLLFLDELQSAEPYVLESLRYFYEKRRNLHVIAAGSLMEFMLEASSRNPDKAFPMPVGRIEYMYLSPLDFEEFLEAMGKSGLVGWLSTYSIGDDVPDAIHEELSLWLKRYFVIGGMPASVLAYANSGIGESERELAAILSTYRDDFPKYGKKVNAEQLQKVFMRVPGFLGRKLVYSKIDPDAKSRDVSAAFKRLELARIVAKVKHTPANGIPIGFDADEGTFKPLFLDVGLSCRALGLKLDDFMEEADAFLANKGEICEQFIGQHILYSGAEYDEPATYCWIREARNSSAEVDYVIYTAGKIVPVEVKGGKSGAMKGLHFFLNEKHLGFAVRMNADKPSFLADATVTDSIGRKCRYSLLSLPLYMVCQLQRIVRQYKQA